VGGGGCLGETDCYNITNDIAGIGEIL